MLNVSKVVKELRRSSIILWAIKGNSDYISNGYWLIKTDLRKQENRKLLGFLIEIFGEFPKQNKVFNFKKHYNDSPISITNVQGSSWLNVADNKGNEPIIDTGLIWDFKKGEYSRIFKGKKYIYLDTKYLELIDIQGADIYGQTPVTPVVFMKEDEVVVILPIRLNSLDEPDFLKNVQRDED